MQRDLGAAETLGIRPDDVMVIIQFNTADEWSFSNGLMLSEEGL